MDLKNYYLDIEKLNSISLDISSKIHDYYRDMIYCYQDGRTSISESIFNTLYNNGYLKNIREEKIDNILNGDNSIDS